ncbi:interferon-induced protein 44-like [Xyrauchen texanus]|uniref:interferon-induced protein 44-like n=1 Tax=Xyrauchen texanus TaxID=154827 RepID=UPI0022421EBB|nr:interferon-induced protein 44-like [Xyrauchen texanus]
MEQLVQILPSPHQKKSLKERLENFAVSNTDVKDIKILVSGQNGAGKSSFMNSVNSAFQGEIVSEALANATFGHSFTRRAQQAHGEIPQGNEARTGSIQPPSDQVVLPEGLTLHCVMNTSYHIKKSETEDLPYCLIDIKGLEPDALAVVQSNDIINTIRGHVKENYEFKGDQQLTPEDVEYYKKDADISDQAFCLVYIMPANFAGSTNQQTIEQIKIIRKEISYDRIPQVIVMTKVDEACPLVKDDLRKIYTSRKIKQKMEECSVDVGVPISNIFPVKNYHIETDTNDDVDVLILKAFDQIVRSANARLRRGAFK